MKKLKLENFRIATLSNPHMIKGGDGEDGDVETETKVCINKSKTWIERPKGGGPTTIDGA